MANANQIIDLLHEAKARSAGGERERFLAVACRDDAALLEQIVSLLEAGDDEVDTDFLKISRLVRPVVPPTEKPGDRIGRYKLLEQIGEGGCGVVYMAEQEEPVRRRVALKVIKLGMDTKQVIARFEAERQALAMMDHPNIAKVLDGGATDAGRPFFVMELVRGIRITDYCDQNNLSTRERLELFIQVCQAVQHAHQKGIIHRDIKPSNILVTRHDHVAVPKVIDFGIAKATVGQLTDRTVFTAFAQFIGTPAYMSPEQAQMSGLDVDTRADIYSLGVLLYELLTGHTPFDARELLAAGMDEMRRKIREDEPAKPSTCLSAMQAMDLTTVARHRHVEPPRLVHQIRGDLDWLVMKCLEKDRTRRYETANNLAADVRRHLENEPVIARPPSSGYRFQKLVRRNKLAFATAAAIAASLVVGFTTTTWMYVRERDARKRATVAESLATERLAEVSAERDSKEVARKEAEDISEFMGEVFQSPDPARDGRTITVAETLDKAAERMAGDLAGQPARRARLRATLGKTYGALGLSGAAIPLQEEVLDYHRTASGPEHRETVWAMHGLAIHYFAVGRRDEALKLREKVLAIQRKVRGAEHRGTPLAMNSLANSYADAGRRDEALKLREEAMALQRKMHGPEHEDVLAATVGLASSYADAGRGDEALKLREGVLAHYRKARGPEHPDTLNATYGLAMSYSDAGRWDEALKLREEVLALHRKVQGPEHPHTCSAMTGLAQSYFDAGRRDEALRLHEEVLALHRKARGPEHPSTLLAMYNLATSCYFAGRRDEALELREEVLLLRRKVLGPEHLGTFMAMGGLADSYSEAGRLDEALELREEVLAQLRKLLGPEHPDTLSAMSGLAHSYSDAGRRDEALELREEELALHRKVDGPEHIGTLMAMHNLAISYSDAGRGDEALKLREEVLAHHRKVLGPEHPETLMAAANLAISYFDNDRREEALKLREEVLELRRKVLGPKHPDTFKAMHNLAISYSDTGRRDEVLKLREEMLEFQRVVEGPEHPAALMAMTVLANSYAEAGRRDEALKLREEVLTHHRKVYGPEHPDLFMAMHNLALSYTDADRGDEALKLREEELALRRKVPGPEQAETARAMYRLAVLSYVAGNRDKAIGLMEETLQLMRKVNGPEDPLTRCAMTFLEDVYLEVGRVAEAVPLLSEDSTREPGDTLLAVNVAALQVWFKRETDHASTCQRMLQWASGTRDPAAAGRVAKLTCLRPIDDATMRDAVLALARRAVELGHGNKADLPWYRMALGMAEYRSGHYAAADEALTAAASTALASGAPRPLWVEGTSSFYRAMSLFKQGKQAEARQLCAATEGKMAPLPADEGNPLDKAESDHDDLILWLACKEARALLNPPPAKPR